MSTKIKINLQIEIEYTVDKFDEAQDAFNHIDSLPAYLKESGILDEIRPDGCDEYNWTTTSDSVQKLLWEHYKGLTKDSGLVMDSFLHFVGGTPEDKIISWFEDTFSTTRESLEFDPYNYRTFQCYESHDDGVTWGHMDEQDARTPEQAAEAVVERLAEFLRGGTNFLVKTVDTDDNNPEVSVHKITLGEDDEVTRPITVQPLTEK